MAQLKSTEIFGNLAVLGNITANGAEVVKDGEVNANKIKINDQYYTLKFTNDENATGEDGVITFVIGE